MPMPDARCPMPDARCPARADAQCPMPDARYFAQSTIALNQSIPLLQKSVVALSIAERARRYQTRNYQLPNGVFCNLHRALRTCKTWMEGSQSIKFSNGIN